MRYLLGFLTSFGYLATVSGLATPANARMVEGRPTLPSDCTTNETWVVDHPKSTNQGQKKWSSHCRILKNAKTSKARKFLAFKILPGRPDNWPFSDERTAVWQVKDASDTLDGLEKIPEPLWDFSLKGIYRMQRSMDYPNPGAQWKDYVVLYDTAFQNETFLERIIAHELAHNYFRLSSGRRLDYAKALGWKLKKTADESSFEAPKCCFVKPEAAYSIDEDFASNIEFYLYQPQTLKQKNPKAFSWTLKTFGPTFKRRGNK